MDALGPVIRLTDDDVRSMSGLYEDWESLWRHYREWDVNEQTSIVFHHQTGIAFQIDYPAQSTWVKPLELSARPIHVCDGHKLPKPSVLERIGKGAIHAFLIGADVCQEPEPIRPKPPPIQSLGEDDEIPF